MTTVNELQEIAGEESRYMISVQVPNLAGEIVVPTTLRWTLSNLRGVVINNRLRESVTIPAEVNNIILYGNDLVLTENTLRAARILLIEATYTEGAVVDMPFKCEYHFAVHNYVMVPIVGGTGFAALTDGGEIAITDGGETAIMD